MHDFLLSAIVVSIFAMLFEGFIVFRNLKNKLHAYLFFNCIVMLVNNTGYLLELLSKTEDEYIAALKHLSVAIDEAYEYGILKD